jgi:hypothetical protein
MSERWVRVVWRGGGGPGREDVIYLEEDYDARITDKAGMRGLDDVKEPSNRRWKADALLLSGRMLLWRADTENRNGQGRLLNWS